MYSSYLIITLLFDTQTKYQNNYLCNCIIYIIKSNIGNFISIIDSYILNLKQKIFYCFSEFQIFTMKVLIVIF